MLLLILAAQMPDPVELYERRFEQRTTPPALYVPQPRTNPPVTFGRPFGSGIPKPKPEQRFIAPDGKPITCRNTGPWVYCF